MKKYLYFTFLIVGLLISIMFITSCTPENLPDLVPVNPNPSIGGLGFCDVDNSGNLVVHIKNQGTASAGSSHVKVSFGNYGESTKAVPALAIGETSTVSFSFPLGCYDPDCSFDITVDVSGEVNESNETNNTQSGWCIG